MKREKKVFIKDFMVLILAMSALACAAINLNVSLNMLANSDEEG